MSYVLPSIYVITAFMDAYLANCLYRCIMSNNKKDIKYPFLIFLAFPISILVLNHFITMTYPRVLLGSLFLFILSIFLYDGNLLVKLFISALFASILLVGDIFTYGFVLLIFPDYLSSPTEHVFLLGSIMFYMYIYIIAIIFKTFPIKSIGTISVRQGLLLVIMPLISSLTISLLINFFKSKSINEFYIYLVPAIFYLLMLFFIVIFFRNMVYAMSQSRLRVILDKQIENYKVQYETLEAAYRSLRMIRHDWRNHMLILDNLISLAKWDELKNYVDDSKGIIFDDILPSCGNTIVDVLLGNLYNRAKVHGITITVEGNLLNELGVSQTDLCALFGNALDNAFEACQQISIGEKEILIRLNVVEPYLYFSIANPLAFAPRMIGDSYMSTKQDSGEHGIGLSNIQAIVDRYDGHLSIRHTATRFIVRGMLRGSDFTDRARKTTDHAHF